MSSESVKKLAKRDRHVATLLAMTYQKAVLCVIAVKIAPNCVIAMKTASLVCHGWDNSSQLCHCERVARGNLYGN